MEDFETKNGELKQSSSFTEIQDMQQALDIIGSLKKEISDLRQANELLNEKNGELIQDQRTDPKTGVLTEQYFNNFQAKILQNKLKQFNEASPEEKEQLEKHLFFLLDMNGLKKINDKQGYEAGDLAIASVAESLKKIVRANDLLIRMNTAGDEFILITMLKPGTDVEYAENVIAERINCVISENSQNRLSVSIGSALLENHNSLIDTRNSAEIDLKQQKAKLYESKIKKFGSSILQIFS